MSPTTPLPRRLILGGAALAVPGLRPAAAQQAATTWSA